MDTIPTQGDSCVVGVIFLRAKFADDACVSDVSLALVWDVIVAYGFECDGPGYLWKMRISWVFSDALAEAA